MTGRGGYDSGGRRAPVLVLGIGNELFTDEGLGIQAARRLARSCPDGVEVIDGGTLGLALLPEIAGRDAVLILDAVSAAGRAPGEILVLRDDEVSRGQALLMSAHQIGIGAALATAELAGTGPGRLAAVGMVPESLETGYGLSATATRELDRMVAHAAGVLARWSADRNADRKIADRDIADRDIADRDIADRNAEGDPTCTR